MRVLFLLFTLNSLLLVACKKEDNTPKMPPQELPKVENFTFSNPTDITHNFYGPGVGQTFVYQGGEVGQAPEEEIRIERRSSTKMVMGITCIIHHDVVYLNNIIIEDTDDWLAQDDDGNLWYLGEFVKNYKDNGTFQDNDGSWEAGVDGALPGFWLPVNPTVGQKYYQEWLQDEAEDYATILATDASVTIGLGTYENCLKTEDINPFESGVTEHKYYAPGIGFILEEKYEDGELVEKVELVEIIE
jgi:hypothetical protein